MSDVREDRSVGVESNGTAPDRTAGFQRLREPFPAEHVGKLPKPTKRDAKKGKCKPQREGGDAPTWQDYCCGGYHGLPAVHLDYVGHAAVTDRLLEVDPEWKWEPKAGWDENGEPRFVRDDQGRPIRLWIDLTVLGVTRPGVGTVEAGAFDAEKQLIGDALRNAGMRFGVALGLWIKGSEEEHAAKADTPAPATEDDPEQWFRDNGWADGKVAHDAYRAQSVALRNSLGAEARADFRDWMEEHDLAFNRAHTRTEAEAIREELEGLRDFETTFAPEDGQRVPVERPPSGPPLRREDLTPVPVPEEDPPF
jgi:hypothetical protein